MELVSRTIEAQHQFSVLAMFMSRGRRIGHVAMLPGDRWYAVTNREEVVLRDIVSKRVLERTRSIQILCYKVMAIASGGCFIPFARANAVWVLSRCCCHDCDVRYVSQPGCGNVAWTIWTVLIVAYSLNGGTTYVQHMNSIRMDHCVAETEFCRSIRNWSYAFRARFCDSPYLATSTSD